MEFLEILKSRRSIRHFSNQAVSDELITKILQAAFSAPSAGNQQPWHFVVITDRKVLDQIPSVHPYAKMITEAAAAIVVCGDLQLDKHKGFWVQDCSAATMNILLAVHSLGLGGVWCGCYPREDRVKGLKKLLQLPESVIPLALVPIGYSAETKGPEDRYKHERVHANSW